MSKTAVEARQHEPRLGAHMAAKIVAPGQVSPAPCVVREISPAGAKLEIADGWIIPRTFWLRITGDTCLHHCALVWRDGQAVGVEFSTGHGRTWWQHRRASNQQLPNRARIGG
jgi:hypothetical protein